jgi:hypothetical protein
VDHALRQLLTPARRVVTDLATPVAVLGVAAVAAALTGRTLPAWALAGALAGYALSGSV